MGCSKMCRDRYPLLLTVSNEQSCIQAVAVSTSVSADRPFFRFHSNALNAKQ